MTKTEQEELILLLESCIIKPKHKDYFLIFWWSIFNKNKLRKLYEALKEGRHFRASMDLANE